MVFAASPTRTRASDPSPSMPSRRPADLAFVDWCISKSQKCNTAISREDPASMALRSIASHQYRIICYRSPASLGSGNEGPERLMVFRVWFFAL